MIMKKSFFPLGLCLATFIGLTACCSQPADPSTHLERNFQSGIDTVPFARMANDIAHVTGTSELHDLIVIKDGKIVYEYYDPAHCPTQKHAMWSASKTFTATAIGFAVQEGLLSVQDKVTKFFSPDELPAAPSDTLQRLTVWHLLTMSSGFAHDVIGDVESLDYTTPAKRQLHDSFIFEPGTRFRYNSMNTYLLSAIITKLTKQTVVDYLTPRLFQPLGIADYYWKESSEGYSMGGWGLFIRPEDFSKMGLWMLQRGQWEGRQLLNAEWFDEAMSSQIQQTIGLDLTAEECAERQANDDWQAGYGYQMWHCTVDAYRLDGAWGQFSIVCPEKNAVITLNALTTNTAKLLKYVWKNVYEHL